MSDAFTAWLVARRPPPPADLRAALVRAFGAAAPSAAESSPPMAPAAEHSPGEAPAPAQLAQAAMAALVRSLALGEGRAAAYELLVADALLTYAIERAAEHGLGMLHEVLEDWGPAELGRLPQVAA